MLPASSPDRIQIAFDDDRLVDHAGLLLPATLAGGDCIDDADALRADGTGRVLGCTVKVPPALGTFPESVGELPCSLRLFLLVHPTITNPGECRSKNACNAGVSPRQGPHHEAQKFSSTCRPR